MITLTATVVSVSDAPNTEIEFGLPPDVRVVRGEVVQFVDLAAGAPQAFSIDVQSEQEGYQRIFVTASGMTPDGAIKYSGADSVRIYVEPAAR